MKYTDVTTHEIACKVMNIDPNAMPDVSMRPSNQQQAIIATIQQWDIADAINKLDKFVPDYNDPNQEKWFVVFDGSNGFRFHYSNFDRRGSFSYVGSRLCFRNGDIADFFGKTFNEIHIKALTKNT